MHKSRISFGFLAGIALLLVAMIIGAPARAQQPQFLPDDAHVTSVLTIHANGDVDVQQSIMAMPSRDLSRLVIGHKPGGDGRAVEFKGTVINGRPVTGVPVQAQSGALPGKAFRGYTLADALPAEQLIQIDRAFRIKSPFTSSNGRQELQFPVYAPEGFTVRSVAVAVALPQGDPDAQIKLSASGEPGQYGGDFRSDPDMRNTMLGEWGRRLDPGEHLNVEIAVSDSVLAPSGGTAIAQATEPPPLRMPPTAPQTAQMTPRRTQGSQRRSARNTRPQQRPVPRNQWNLQLREAQISAAITVAPDGAVEVRQTIVALPEDDVYSITLGHKSGHLLRPVEMGRTIINGRTVLAEPLDELDNLFEDYASSKFNVSRVLPKRQVFQINQTYQLKRPFVLAGNRRELQLPLFAPDGYKIKAVNVTVTLPREDPEAVISTSAHDRPGDFSGTVQQVPGMASTLTGEWTQQLDMGTHLLLDLAVRDSLIAPPTPVDMILSNEDLQRATGIIGAVLALQILAFIGMRLRSASRPPEPQAMPPAGISPALARYVRDRGKLGHETFSAALASLEDHGLIELVQAGPKPGSFVVTGGKRHELPRDASAEERYLYEDLKPHLVDARAAMALSSGLEQPGLQATPMFGIGQKGGGLQERRVWRDAASRVAATLQDSYAKTLFTKRKIWLLPALLVGLGGYGWQIHDLEGERIFIALFMTVWLSGWTAGTMALLGKVFSAWKFAFSGGIGAFIFGVIGASFITAFSVPFVFGWVMGATMLTFGAGLTATAILLSTLVLHMLFRNRMVGLTEQGAEMLAKIRGWEDSFDQLAPVGDDSMPGMPAMAGSSRQPGWSIAFGHRPGPRWTTIKARLASMLGNALSPKSGAKG